ncbi:MAG: PilW family protein [Steroidobacteraceae bacterium]
MRLNHSLHLVTMRHHQRGVNLIEIMVAMAIGLFLVLGATTLYVNTKKTSDVDDSIARLQETARYAMSVIETDVRMANYWGFKKDGADFENKDTNLNLPVGTNAGALGASGSANYCGAAYATRTENYVEGSNNSYGLPSACPANSTAVTTSDTLTVRRASTTSATASATQLQICSTRKTSTIVKSATATCTGGELRNLITNGYYIDQGSQQSATLPSLRRKTLSAGPAFIDTEIIPGVEDMQIEFGWDNSSTDAAGVVQYLQPTAAAIASGRIVSVRVWLLIRAEQPDFAFTDNRTYTYGDRPAYTPGDNFRRLLVSRTFFIRNVTGT